MNNKPPKDIKEAKKMLEKEMIKGILEYLRNGIFPNNSPNSYMNAYTIVQGMADEGDTQCETLFDYHNKTVQKYIEDCYKIVSKESSNHLIEAVIEQTEKINFLIYWMFRIFTYLDRFYTKSKVKITLSQNSIKLYKEHFFNPLENDIYTEVNKLIKEDRNCNLEPRPNIKTILKIIQFIGFLINKAKKKVKRYIKINGMNNISEMKQLNSQKKKEIQIFIICQHLNIFYHS